MTSSRTVQGGSPQKQSLRPGFEGKWFTWGRAQEASSGKWDIDQEGYRYKKLGHRSQGSLDDNAEDVSECPVWGARKAGIILHFHSALAEAASRPWATWHFYPPSNVGWA